MVAPGSQLFTVKWQDVFISLCGSNTNHNASNAKRHASNEHHDARLKCAEQRYGKRVDWQTTS